MTVQRYPRDPNEATQRRGEQAFAELTLPPKFLTELIRGKPHVSFRRHETIFRRGSRADFMYWVVSGLVKIDCIAPNGSQVLLKVAGPGDFIGFINRLEAGEHCVQAFEARAIRDARVVIFTRQSALELLKTLDSSSLISVIEAINTSWSSAYSRQIEFLTHSFRDRLWLTLLNLAQRFGARDSRGLLLTLELSHDDLARMIASSRPMVSRLIGEFVAEGILARHGKQYVVLKPNGLEPNWTRGRAYRRVGHGAPSVL